jgi:mRNA interferase HigB
MNVISRKTLKLFWEKHPEAEQPLRAWYHEADQAGWKNSAEIKAKYRSASIIDSERVVFNIAGNKYRLIVVVKYHYKAIYVRFVGTHKAYDKVDAETI